MVHQRNRASDGRCLYYYGSLATLSSMLSTRQIWLSDIRKSNDSDEIAYGVRQIKHRLDAVLSSLDIIQLIGALNDEFDISIPATEIIPQNFNSVDAMVAMVERLADE